MFKFFLRQLLKTPVYTGAVLIQRQHEGYYTPP